MIIVAKKLKVISLFAAIFVLAANVAVVGTAQAEMSDTVKGGAGGALIGALAGSLGGYAGAGALIGGGIGLAGGAMSDSAKASKKKAEQDAYERGLRDGSRVTYKEGPDRQHVDKFGDKYQD